jgi:hypothetical protein
MTMGRSGWISSGVSFDCLAGCFGTVLISGRLLDGWCGRFQDREGVVTWLLDPVMRNAGSPLDCHMLEGFSADLAGDLSAI